MHVVALYLHSIMLHISNSFKDCQYFELHCFLNSFVMCYIFSCIHIVNNFRFSPTAGKKKIKSIKPQNGGEKKVGKKETNLQLELKFSV